MSGLPEHVSDQEIEEMFKFADRDEDGKICWEEFLLMISPVQLAEAEKPRLVKSSVCRITEDNQSEGDNKGMAHLIRISVLDYLVHPDICRGRLNDPV